jgi:hypothetical protein
VDVIPTIRTSAGPALLMLKATYEVFDSQTGLGAVLTSGLPARRAALAPQGLAAGQIMRLIVTSIPPDPCLAALSFADSSGNPLGTTLQVDLTPGQSKALELVGPPNLQAGQRIEVKPLVTLTAARCLRPRHGSHVDLSERGIAITRGRLGRWWLTN